VVVVGVEVMPTGTRSLFLDKFFWMASRQDVDIMPGACEPARE
jgi:hypothetical protein